MNIPNKFCVGHRNCQLNTEHLVFIADNTVSDWRRVLKFLGIGENEIRTVEEDSSLRSNTNDSREVAYQGYLKWKNRDPLNAHVVLARYRWVFIARRRCCGLQIA